MKVSVLDMQPIDPPAGGGRLRLLGLYHGLGPDIETTYIGTYDWPGPGYRRHQCSASLVEIDVPLSEEHFRAVDKLRHQVGGKTIIDAVFHQQAHLSPEYVRTACEAAVQADVIVFSHPWIWPLADEVLDYRRQLVVYDSHNVEGLLRTDLLDDGGKGTGIAREVVRIEHGLCHAADLILACSHEDRLLFNKLYGVPLDRIRVVPNGVFTERLRPADEPLRAKMRRGLGVIVQFVALFLGSAYAPNVEAAAFICRELAPALPDVEFVIAGGVGEALREAGVPVEHLSNVRLTGFLEEADKLRWLHAADLAINPMFSGSGTNIKMFDFMAAGLPIVTTPIGARGIETAGEPVFAVSEGREFHSAVRALLDDQVRRRSMSALARRTVERHYSWERISRMVGTLLRHHSRGKGHRPFYSVVVPTYERHASLMRLMECLAAQNWRNFEVIVVDQSAEPWPERYLDFGVNMLYFHTDVRGAISARNMGAALARSRIIAFTDDDCEPSPQWLSAARPYFDDRRVVGVEGLIRSEYRDDPEWRAVTNEGFPGLGFMTANLYIRHEIFVRLNGFDEAFDNPHFREDTDFAWRALRYGNIPFSEQAWVFHPPHRRVNDRESLEARAKFFVKDAQLFERHPERYRDLFYKESQWKQSPLFWRYLFLGFERIKQPPPDFIVETFHLECRGTDHWIRTHQRQRQHVESSREQ